MSATALARSGSGIQNNGLATHPHLPFERGGHVVDPVGEAQPQRLLERLADRGLGPQPGELERAAAAVDDASLRVAGEERSGRSRVVVVEQLEQVGEATLLAPPRLTPEARRCDPCPSTGCRNGDR